MVTHPTKPLPTYDKGRRCDDCGTIISIYVPGTRCRLHRESVPLRDMSRVRERTEAAALLRDILLEA